MHKSRIVDPGGNLGLLETSGELVTIDGSPLADSNGELMKDMRSAGRYRW
jgi:hypothetical protein